MARILVADDNEQFVSMLCATLEDAGHDVVKASSGLAVTDIVDREELDLLVLDVLMPGMSGDAVAVRVGREIPVVLMTGDSGGQFALPGVPLLRKPFSEQQLLDAVAAALR